MLGHGFLFSTTAADAGTASNMPPRLWLECKYGVHCRRNFPRSWSLAHLSGLTELTLRGESAHAVVSALLRSHAAAVLPASLLMWRQQNPGALRFSAEGR